MKTEKILHFLQEKYEFHCAILYGSRAGLNFRNESDYDILCIRKEGKRIREIIKYENLTIDLIVDDEAILNRPHDALYLWKSKILIDEKKIGLNLVDTIQELLSHPPEALPSSRFTQRKKQILDSLIYINQDDVLGDYRRNDLLAKLLPLYCNFSRIWDLGDIHTLYWLENNDFKNFDLFRKALKKDALYSDIEALVNSICNIQSNND